MAFFNKKHIIVMNNTMNNNISTSSLTDLVFYVADLYEIVEIDNIEVSMYKNNGRDMIDIPITPTITKLVTDYEWQVNLGAVVIPTGTTEVFFLVKVTDDDGYIHTINHGPYAIVA